MITSYRDIEGKTALESEQNAAAWVNKHGYQKCSKMHTPRASGDVWVTTVKVERQFQMGLLLSDK